MPRGQLVFAQQLVSARHGRRARLVYDLFVKAAVDGRVLLDVAMDVDVFLPITNSQPLFKAWRAHMYEEQTVIAPDGKTKHLFYKKAREELFCPVDATNIASRAKTRTIECALIKVSLPPQLVIFLPVSHRPLPPFTQVPKGAVRRRRAQVTV